MDFLEKIIQEYNENHNLQNYFQLVDEFDYEKNGIQLTKDFFKYLLFDLLWKITKK